MTEPDWKLQNHPVHHCDRLGCPPPRMAVPEYGEIPMHVVCAPRERERRRKPCRADGLDVLGVLFGMSLGAGLGFGSLLMWVAWSEAPLVLLIVAACGLGALILTWREGRSRGIL